MTPLARLCASHGIEPTYRGIDSREHVVPETTLAELAHIFGLTTEARTPPPGIDEALAERDPPQCFVPQALGDARAWGVTCQVASLCSARNLGMGDFADLARLARIAADEGADFLGINPLHAMFWSDPRRISPFSPSNRRQLNPVYVAPDWVDGFDGLLPDEADEAARLRAAPLIDGLGAGALKNRVLRRLFAAAPPDDPEFDAFVREGGPALAAHARFETVSAVMAREGHGAGWLGWPAPYRDCNAPEVAELAELNQDEHVYHLWLQWQADRQLARVQRTALEAGMRVGLYLDIAVGAAADGSSSWTDPTRTVPELKIGAPPDDFSLSGQDWGLAPISPVIMSERQGAPVAEIMATVMRHSGAVRIDHAMSLARLWLIPFDKPALEGAYIRYPLSALLARLAEESQAARAIVIGEDLGVVPEGFRPLMAQRAIHSYKVWFFERGAHGLPEVESWPRHCPRLPRHARHGDASRLGGGPRHRAARAPRLPRHGRLRQRRARPARRTRPASPAGSAPRTDTFSLSLAMHAHMAASPCRLAALQVEDALGLEAQVNVPGTTDEYPNWRNRLPVAARRAGRASRLAIPCRGHAKGAPAMSDIRMPTATYRVQFREGMDFARATAIVPYLAELGVSHLYASPIFQAQKGSTHGYDVTDHRRFDEELGGLDGFCRLSDALKQHGLGLILDIVPNHMAASVQNPWWADVLRHGRESRYAGHFDIDWEAPSLVLPILGQPYGDALEAGELTLGRDEAGYVLRYYEHAFPLSPATTATIAEAAGIDRSARPDDATLERLSRDHELIHRIHEAQPYRLAYWRLARDGLTNRRFFEISDLVGVRVEEPRVFDDVHRFLFEMIEAGRVDGVRVDHVDGLADPAGYLERLAAELPLPVPVWVEKILARGEALPQDWPVAGTTGYEFADLVAATVTDRASRADPFGRLRRVHGDRARLCGDARRGQARDPAPELRRRARYPDRPRRSGAGGRPVGARLGPRQLAPGADRHPGRPARLPDLSARGSALGGRPGHPRARAGRGAGADRSGRCRPDRRGAEPPDGCVQRGRPPAPHKAAADQRRADGQGGRGHAVLPLQPPDFGKRGRRRARPPRAAAGRLPRRDAPAWRDAR